MVNLTNADSALRVYIDAISEQLNYGTGAFFAAIEKNSNYVCGKDVRKPVTHGINGGIGAGAEDGNLPKASSQGYTCFTAPLKNLYGVIEISDKAVRASENDPAAAVNLLNAEMESLLASSKLNLARMLMGNGTGELAIVSNVDGNTVTVEATHNFVEGMCVEFLGADGEVLDTDLRVTKIDKENKEVTFNRIVSQEVVGFCANVVGSYKNEITGLRAIFSSNVPTLYGLKKSQNPWLQPYTETNIGEITELKLQTALDEIEEKSGNAPDMILCSWGVRRAIQNMLSKNRTAISTTELAGGYKAITYNGIPVVADRFVTPGELIMVNTKDFTLHQLCDWQWLEGDDGRILKQIPGKPVYTATLVKYAELMCARPCGQGIMYGITEA